MAMILGITPARGGSKSIPKKSIREICGKPLIAWTIEAAKKSRLLDRYVVSTEDKEIAEIARKYGAEVIPRPPELATDEATTLSVLQDVLKKIDADVVVLLQCTSPVRDDGLIDYCIGRFLETVTDSLATGFICKLYEWGTYSARRQDLKGFFHDDGNIFVIKAELIRKGQLWGNKMEKVMISKEQNFEIDDEFDFWLNEQVLKKRAELGKWYIQRCAEMGGLGRKIKSKDYHDYIIKDGKFIGAFEEMYQNIDDPWHHGDATAIQYDLALYLINRYRICEGEGLVLDIGCGKGAFTARLKQQMPTARILGVDIAPTAIKKAKQKYGYLGIEFQVMDVQKEYKNITGKFDLVVMSQFMWYTLPSFREIVNNLGESILKNDGHLLINQCFYRSEEQKYGKEIVSTIEDMLNLVNLELIEMIELNRLTNHDAIVLFKNSKSAKQGSQYNNLGEIA